LLSSLPRSFLHLYPLPFYVIMHHFLPTARVLTDLPPSHYCSIKQFCMLTPLPHSSHLLYPLPFYLIKHLFLTTARVLTDLPSSHCCSIKQFCMLTLSPSLPFPQTYNNHASHFLVHFMNWCFPVLSCPLTK
jgi:hypothetical protein